MLIIPDTKQILFYAAIPVPQQSMKDRRQWKGPRRKINGRWVGGLVKSDRAKVCENANVLFLNRAKPNIQEIDFL